MVDEWDSFQILKRSFYSLYEIFLKEQENFNINDLGDSVLNIKEFSVSASQNLPPYLVESLKIETSKILSLWQQINEKKSTVVSKFNVTTKKAVTKEEKLVEQDLHSSKLLEELKDVNKCEALKIVKINVLDSCFTLTDQENKFILISGECNVFNFKNIKNCVIFVLNTSCRTFNLADANNSVFIVTSQQIRIRNCLSCEFYVDSNVKKGICLEDSRCCYFGNFLNLIEEEDKEQMFDLLFKKSEFNLDEKISDFSWPNLSEPSPNVKTIYENKSYIIGIVLREENLEIIKKEVIK